MNAWWTSYTIRALGASLLLDVAAALAIAAGGGTVDWRIIAYSLGNKAVIGVARLLLGDSPAETHPFG
ncbi:MAG: hypothetical protein Q8Q14_01860 [Gemmatimonadales bacterium]|nr:hypothetical protein [Gemmatimonadales bacterium]